MFAGSVQDLPPEAQARVRHAQEMAAKLMAQAAAQPQQPVAQPTAAAPAELNPMLRAAQEISRKLAEKVNPHAALALLCCSLLSIAYPLSEWSR